MGNYSNLKSFNYLVGQPKLSFFFVFISVPRIFETLGYSITYFDVLSRISHMFYVLLKYPYRISEHQHLETEFSLGRREIRNK